MAIGAAATGAATVAGEKAGEEEAGATGAGETGVAGRGAGTGESLDAIGVEGITGEVASGVGGPSINPRRVRTLSSVNSARLEVLI